MRKISTLLAGLLMTTGAMAQSTYPGTYFTRHQPADKLEQSRQLTHRLMRAYANTANKSTATYQRMIGYSDYEQDQNGQVVIYDSASLSYTGMKGSEYDYNSMSIGNFDPLFGAILPDNKLLFKASTLDIYPNTLSTNPDEAYTITYDNDDNVTEIYGVMSSGPDMKILMSYNNNSEPTFAQMMEANGPDWDTLYKRGFNYFQGHLQQDTLVEKQNNIWVIYQKYSYMHDGNGRVAHLFFYNTSSGSLAPVQNTNFQYNNNDQIIAAGYNYVGQGNFKDTFTYTTGVALYTKVNTYEMDQNVAWLDVSYMERTLNTQMKPAVAKFVEWHWQTSTWDTASQNKYTYNTFGSPIHDSSFSYTNDVMDPEPSHVQHLYYEDYEDLNVNNTTRKIEVTVYPNPATDIINVNNSDRTPMQLQVVNAVGQTVKKARSTGNAKLSIADLTAGSYWLTVSDMRGNKLHTQTIVKQ